jgi:hypothetical protein
LRAEGGTKHDDVIICMSIVLVVVLVLVIENRKNRGREGTKYICNYL